MGTFGEFFCNVAKAFSSILPATPEDLKLASLANQLAGSVPFVGGQLILEAAQNISLVLYLVVPYKVYKIMGGKF